MKILYGITSSNWGGAQENVFQLISHRLKKNDNVVLVVGNKGALTAKVKSEFPQVKIYIINTMVRNINFIKDIKSMVTFRKIIRKEKPDIIHLHSSKAGVIGRIAGGNNKAKTIYTVHGWPFTNKDGSVLKNSIFSFIERSLSSVTDYYICVSRYDECLGVKKKIFSKGENNYETIHNAIKKHNDVFRRGKLAGGALNIIMVARFSPQKDQEGLIRVLSKLDKKSYKMTFVGDGPTLAKNKALCERLNISDRVNFLGFKENVISLLNQNDLFILSSHYEGLPYSIIEAMSTGLPIIASNVGGNNELVANNVNGYLYDSYKDLYLRLRELIGDKEKVKKMGEESYRMFEDNFQIEKQMKKVDKVYNLLINRGYRS